MLRHLAIVITNPLAVLGNRTFLTLYCLISSHVYTHLSLNIIYILCVSLRCRDWYENKQYRPWQENSVSISFTLPSVETAIQNPALGQLVLSRSSKKLTILNNLKSYFHTWNVVLICSKCTSVQLKSFQMELLDFYRIGYKFNHVSACK